MRRGDTPPSGYSVPAPPNESPRLAWWQQPRYAAAVLGLLLALLVGSLVALGVVATSKSDDADRELAKARDQIRDERERARDDIASEKADAQDQIDSLRDEAAEARADVRRERRKLERLQGEVDGVQDQIARNTVPGDGTYVVGEDIDPGTYRADASPGCYWARLRSLDTSDIIDNDNADGPVVIEVLPSDRALELSGCADFKKQG